MPDATTIPPLRNFHHVAFRCRDTRETRDFYEGVLGMPLAAGLRFAEQSEADAPLEFMHIFFQLGDGNYLAFFDGPESATEDHFKKKSGVNRHVAIETGTLEDLARFEQRLKAHGVDTWGPVDHGFIKSIYFYDPNGITVEITARMPRHAAFLADERRKLESELAAWTEETRSKRAARQL
jgi:catechol 2,3-dioxygenase-like lactoylglutathione lyase family enzyme